MNDEFPHEPGTESEAQMTALLLGELTGAEAASLRQAIEDDLQMAALHERLQKTVSLVREVAASPSEPSAVEAAPMKLSEERRQKLLAQFKTVKVKEFEAAKKPERERVTPTVRLLELAAIIMVMAVLAGLLLPSLAKSKSKATSIVIRNNLKQIDLAKQMWADDNKKSAGDVPTSKDLAPYLGQGPEGLPPSRLGETYIIGSVGEKAAAEMDTKKVKELGGKVVELNTLSGGRSFGASLLKGFRAPEAPQKARLNADGKWELENQSVVVLSKSDSQNIFARAKERGEQALNRPASPTTESVTRGRRPEIYLPPQELQPANPHVIALDNADPANVQQVLQEQFVDIDRKSVNTRGQDLLLDVGVGQNPNGGRAVEALNNSVVSNPLVNLQQTILQQQNTFAETPPPQVAAETRSGGGGGGGSAVFAQGQQPFGGASGGAGPSVNGKSVTTAGQAEDFRRNAGVGQADPDWVGVLNHSAPKQSGNNPFVSNYGYIATNGQLDLNGIQNQSSAASSGGTTAHAGNFGLADGSVQQYSVSAFRAAASGGTNPADGANVLDFGPPDVSTVAGRIADANKTQPQPIDPATGLPIAPPNVEIRAKFADVTQNNSSNFTWSYNKAESAPVATGANTDSFNTEIPKPSAAPAAPDATPEITGTYFNGVGAINNGDVGGVRKLDKEGKVAETEAGKVPLLGETPVTGRLFATTPAQEPAMRLHLPDVERRGAQALTESAGRAKRSGFSRQTRALTPLAGTPTLETEAALSPPSPVASSAPSKSDVKATNDGDGVYSLKIVGYVNVNIPTNGQDLVMPGSKLATELASDEALKHVDNAWKNPPMLGGKTPSKRDYSNTTLPGDAQVSIDPDSKSLIVMSDDATFKNISNVVARLDQPKKAEGFNLDAVNLGVTSQVTNSADFRYYLDLNHKDVTAGAKADDKPQAAADESILRRPVQLAYQNKKQELEELKEAQKSVEEKTDAPLKKPAAPAPEPQPEVFTSTNAFSTFSLNVADVSFKLAAVSLEKGVMPEPASIRSEEFINAFDYRDPEAPPGVPIAFAWERARYPFAQNRDLLRFSLKTAATGRAPGRPLNIVLLLDNSGSMERADRVAIIREALRVLAGQLQPQDRLSIVTFARTARLFVDAVPGDQAGDAVEKVSGLTPQGGTNLEDAMKLAYETARRHYFANGVNRVVLLTDGAANLGNVDPEALKQKVEANRKQGLALDCFGIGWEGYNDDLLEVLARNGDGRYGFLNTPEEAATGFAHQLAGALNVAAADVKVQVEFNPARVTVYRQIGYAKLQLKKEQFRDNTVDAAEIGAAEAGNALYTLEVNPNGEGPLATVRVRYKVPGTEEFHEHEWAVPYTGNACSMEQSSPAMRLTATASAFSEWLAASPYAAEVTPDALLKQLAGVPDIYGVDARPQKLEWMLRQAKSLQGK